MVNLKGPEIGQVILTSSTNMERVHSSFQQCLSMDLEYVKARMLSAVTFVWQSMPSTRICVPPISAGHATVASIVTV